jgi:hypothetical protein
MNVEEISSVVVDTAFRLHRDLGPGLLESVYEAVLARMLEKRGLLVNFGAASFKEGAKRVANRHRDFASSCLRVNQ